MCACVLTCVGVYLCVCVCVCVCCFSLCSNPRFFPQPPKLLVELVQEILVGLGEVRFTLVFLDVQKVFIEYLFFCFLLQLLGRKDPKLELRNLFSPSSVSHTLSRDYFLFMGQLSASKTGVTLLEKLNAFRE